MLACHDHMLKAGFDFDKEQEKYFYKRVPEWEMAKKIEKGKRQNAIPASTVEEFNAGFEKWVGEK